MRRRLDPGPGSDDGRAGTGRRAGKHSARLRPRRGRSGLGNGLRRSTLGNVAGLEVRTEEHSARRGGAGDDTALMGFWKLAARRKKKNKGRRRVRQHADRERAADFTVAGSRQRKAGKTGKAGKEGKAGGNRRRAAGGSGKAGKRGKGSRQAGLGRRRTGKRNGRRKTTSSSSSTSCSSGSGSAGNNRRGGRRGRLRSVSGGSSATSSSAASSLSLSSSSSGSGSSTSSTSSIAQAAAVINSGEATSIFCHNCGTVSEVGGGAAFVCGNCGSDFVEAVDGGDGTLPAGMEEQGETFVVFAPTDQLTGSGSTVRITQRTYTNGAAGEGAVRRRRRRRNRTGTSFNPIMLDVMDMFHNGAGADVAAEALVSRLEEAFSMHQQAERATVTRATRSDVIENLASHEVTSDMVEGDDTCAICRVPFATDDDAVELPKCRHYFHRGCVVPWLESHHNCPMCRTPLPAGEIRYVSDQSASSS